MKTKEIEDLQTHIGEIINSNGSFYRQNEEDETLYYIDPATLAKLAYDIIQYAANIFGAIQGGIAATRWIKNKLKDKKKQTPYLLDDKKDEGEISKQIPILKENLKNAELKSELKTDVENILQHHGWPKTDADKDAQKIVNKLGNE